MQFDQVRVSCDEIVDIGLHRLSSIGSQVRCYACPSDGTTSPHSPSQTDQTRATHSVRFTAACRMAQVTDALKEHSYIDSLELRPANSEKRKYP